MGFYDFSASTTYTDSTSYNYMAANIWSDQDTKAIAFAGSMGTDTICFGTD